MRILLFPLFFVFLYFSGTAQTATDLGVWLDHLPYNNVLDVHAEGSTIYCATEQGVFIYDHDEKTIDRVSKVNGLSDVGLTTIGWSDKYKTLLIGYQNGNVDLLQGERVKTVSAIRQSGNYTGLKQVNRIVVEKDIAYICTNFGIVTYDIGRDIILETFIIGEEGSVVAVNDVAFSNDTVYAGTPQGLLWAKSNSALFNFQNWHKDLRFVKPITHVENFNNHPVVNKSSPAPVYDSLFERRAGRWEFVPEVSTAITNRDVRATQGQLSVCNGSSAQTFDENFTRQINVQTAVLPSSLDPTALYLVAACFGTNQDFYWMASNDGLFVNIRYDGTNSYQENILPNSPASKNAFKLYHNDVKLFVAPGGISAVYSPVFNNDGYFDLEDYNWTNHPNSEFKGFKDIVAFISDEDDPSHFYASAYGSGILEFENYQYKRFIHDTTTDNGFPTLPGSTEHRVGGFSADAEGNIWFTNSKTDKPLAVIHPDGSVESFSLGALANSSTDIKDILYTTQDQIWIQTKNTGIVVVNRAEGAGQEAKRLVATEGLGDLPTETVLTFAEDQDGEIWIGTNEGLAVLYSPQNIFEEERNYDAQIIVIDEDGDGNGERVLGSEQINDIEVDGSNKKWFATANSGAFYTSENGKEQIFNFNKTNSPLPSDNVTDIEIDDITGMVYFATDQGIVSFQGAATEGVDEHTDVFAYPNPVKPGYTGPILIRGLVTNAQVKITDIEGNIVFETIAEGGQAVWSGKNFSGQPAQSGVYLAYITNDEGSATAVTKILIVR